MTDYLNNVLKQSLCGAVIVVSLYLTFSSASGYENDSAENSCKEEICIGHFYDKSEELNNPKYPEGTAHFGKDDREELCKRFIALEEDGRKPLIITDINRFIEDIKNNWVVQKKLQEHNINPDKVSNFLKAVGASDYNIFLYGRNNASEDSYMVLSSLEFFKFYLTPLEGNFVDYYWELHKAE